MVSRYRSLFARPGTVPMTLAALLTRMPLSMVAVGLITMIAQTHASYTLAGAVAATFALTVASVSPQVGRLVDRHGQRRVVPVTALVSVAALVALAAVSASGGPEALLFVFAFLAGVMPSAPALVRSRWRHLLTDSHQVHTAYSWETVLDEACFILGPPVAIGLSVALFPQAGPLAAAVFLLAGAMWLSTQRATEPPAAAPDSSAPAGRNKDGLLQVLSQPTVAAVVVVMVALGVIVGTVDVVSVAFAEEQGTPALASVVLSVYALGACASGFIFGTRTLTWPLGRLLRIGMLATALTTLPMLVATSITGLSTAVFVAGVFFAPTMILAARLIEQNTPASSLTEALTWSTAGLGLGTAIGPATVGPIIDAHRASTGFWVAVAAGGVLLALVALTRRALTTLPQETSP